jgi:hypothetical protein
MVSVATSLDVPIKLLWPKALLNPSAGFMMLGLGDIVVPGLFVATSLRFDHVRGAGATPYFTACLAAYALGLSATMAVMHTFKAAQPALLYLRCGAVVCVNGEAKADDGVGFAARRASSRLFSRPSRAANSRRRGTGRTARRKRRREGRGRVRSL